MLDILRADGFGDDAISHGFTTRDGGVSEGPYASLNLSWSRGDDKAADAELRCALVAIGIVPPALSVMSQLVLTSASGATPSRDR